MADQIKPYLTSDDLIEAIKRKIAIPISQETFDEDDLLRFVNEEMYLSQVPSVLLYHEEFFVHPVDVSFAANTSRYSIPSRAIGGRMRDLVFVDSSGNEYEMARVSPDDKSLYQSGTGSSTSPHKYYIEGNDIVLVPSVTGTPSGNLRFYIYLRPNQLVQNSRAGIVSAISSSSTTIKKHVLASASYISVAGDTITSASHGFPDGARLTFTTTGTLPTGIEAGTTYYVVNTATNTFQISESLGGSAVDIEDVGSGLHTVTRTLVLTNTIDPEDINYDTDTITLANHDYANGDRVILSNSTTMPTPLVENKYYYIVNRATNTFQLSTTVGGDAVDITFCGEGSTTIQGNLTTITCESLPTNITNSSYVDFLQTESPHKIYSYDTYLASNAISSNTITIRTSELPSSLIVGDYICSRHEAIVPQLPSDLHNGLAERAGARILASLGDTEGLQVANQKIQEINQSQSTIIDNRSEGSPLKVTAKNSILRHNRRRRY